MKEGQLKSSNRSGCLMYLALIYAFPMLAALAVLPLGVVYLCFRAGEIGNGLFVLAVEAGAVYLFIKYKRKGKKEEAPKNPNTAVLRTEAGGVQLGNPFRGVFVLGAAGSGKSESIAVPLLSEFVRMGFAGVVYDFKFPTLAKDVQSFVNAKGSVLRHFYLDFNNPAASYRVNPLNPRYLPNTSYAREYAQAIISNLMKESIKKPDFWTRSATDLLTACIWYLKEERPDICDLPHVLAMITSNDTALLKTLQKNVQTAQMTVSIYNAMERGADSQVSGVIGTLQGAIAQINTPELMFLFSGDDFSLDVNDPQNPIILTVGSYPTLTQTFAPLCSLVITVATKLMNQPDKHPSFVLLDEAPTVFIPNIEVLPNTGRSNKIATVIMCQDIAQLEDSYGREKADVLFASCNSHFYGRVASSKTAEILSKQFGKADKVYITSNEGRNTRKFGKTFGRSETIQERDVIKPSEFLNLQVGEFAGLAVESNKPTFRTRFKQAQRPQPAELKKPDFSGSVSDYYKRVRYDINKMLEIGGTAGEYDRDTMKLNETKRNFFGVEY